MRLDDRLPSVVAARILWYHETVPRVHDRPRSLRVGPQNPERPWESLISPTTGVGFYAVGGETDDEMWDHVFETCDHVRAEGLAVLVVDYEASGERLHRTWNEKIGPVTLVHEQFYCYVEFCRAADYGNLVCSPS